MRELVQVKVKALPATNTKGMRCKLTFYERSKVIPWDYSKTRKLQVAESFLESKGIEVPFCSEHELLCEFTQWEKLKEVFA